MVRLGFRRGVLVMRGSQAIDRTEADATAGEGDECDMRGSFAPFVRTCLDLLGQPINIAIRAEP